MFTQKGMEGSWHQAVTYLSKPAHNPDRYNWGDINALFEDQVQVVKLNHTKRQPGTSKVNNLKIKRLGKPRIGSKRLHPSVPDHKGSSKGKKLSFKLGKHGITAKRLLQKTRLMKALRDATKTQK